MEPLPPALAAMTKVLRLKAAFTEEFESTVTLQVGVRPEHLPDHPTKLEL